MQTSMEQLLSYLNLLQKKIIKKNKKYAPAKYRAGYDDYVKGASSHEAESFCLFGCSETG